MQPLVLQSCFGLNVKYGPSLGICRQARWDCADKLHLAPSPPPIVESFYRLGIIEGVSLQKSLASGSASQTRLAK